MNKEKELFREEIQNESKPEEVLEKIVEGKLNKWYSDMALMEQAYVKDEDKTIEEFVKEKVATLGENIQVKRFCRFQIG